MTTPPDKQGRRVHIRIKRADSAAKWLVGDDGSEVIATEESMRRAFEYLQAGKWPPVARGKGRPSLIRDDQYVALHYHLLRPYYPARGQSKLVRFHVASAWGILDQRVRAAIRKYGRGATEWLERQSVAPQSPQWLRMLVNVNAYGVEYVQDIAKLDKAKPII